MSNGLDVSPRGIKTRELPQKTIRVDMRRPVLTVPARQLNHRFMAAEAFWILSGDDRVETIAPYNKNIAQFSDDGVRYFGAYGPKVLAQLAYVVDALSRDRCSRQAGLTIWRENPPKTKDVPCTVAAFFSIREERLNAHVFMRSNDAWLGTPYDVFNFSMLAHLVCAHLNEAGQPPTSPGKLFLTAASSHLYATNWEAATSCLLAGAVEQNDTPDVLWNDASALIATLRHLRETKPGDSLRWWEHA